jgi:hypothetical protein
MGRNPQTAQEAIEFSAALTDESVRSGAFGKVEPIDKENGTTIRLTRDQAGKATPLIDRLMLLKLLLPLKLKPQFSSKLVRSGTQDRTRDVINAICTMLGHVCRARSVVVRATWNNTANLGKPAAMSARHSIISEVHA